ncbi:tetraspanin-13 isoform X2 [Aricia agestis]|uniref:tetraspanin-13 isoform X2 n=1 Tax=Aricia agestis TaxID=91739 RepID=UPI001C20806C|nr:tetraspanin-13 isoform X2 [Aricia agestis]XP_041986928.1 tetraspanin-13 isoform X2 [Aricia agestis]
MCGGFTCSKNALITLNVLYVVVASILISVAVYAQASSVVTNLPIVGGILACGIFLILISLLGLAGAVKHHQVMLFFYMVILFLLFLVQFSVACACLAVNSSQQEMIAQQGWNKVNLDMREQVQEKFGCCSFRGRDTANVTVDYPACDVVDRMCCDEGDVTVACQCPPCLYKLKQTIDYAFKLCGGIGLFFSFTEFLGVWLTVRYRNQKDPRANPSAFL